MAKVFVPRIFGAAPTPGTPVSVTITGAGDRTNRYVTIGGIKYTTRTEEDITVLTGDTITFGISTSSTSAGKVTINDVTVLTATKDDGERTYDWKVPKGIVSIDIELISSTNGHIIVTTS